MKLETLRSMLRAANDTHQLTERARWLCTGCGVWFDFDGEPSRCGLCGQSGKLKRGPLTAVCCSCRLDFSVVDDRPGVPLCTPCRVAIDTDTLAMRRRSAAGRIGRGAPLGFRR